MRTFARFTIKTIWCRYWDFKMDRNTPLSLRQIEHVERQSQQASQLTATGFSLDASVANPILTADKTLMRPVTARITGIATQRDGVTPLLDCDCRLQYTWIEEQR